MDMPVKLTVKAGAIEISAEAQDPAECADLLKQATDLLAALPQVPTSRTPAGAQVSGSPGSGPNGSSGEGIADGILELLQHAGLTHEDLARAVSLKEPAKPRIVPRLRASDRVPRQRKAAAVTMALAKRGV